MSICVDDLRECKITLCEEALRSSYVRAVRQREANIHWWRLINKPVEIKILKGTAEKLVEPALARLFVDAQFEGLPTDWCINTFKQTYPPFTVCFGEGSWDRYQGYIQRGKSIPSY